MKYELVVIWESGEKEVLSYSDYEEARQAAQYMKTAFGSQISWTGIREARQKKGVPHYDRQETVPYRENA